MGYEACRIRDNNSLTKVIDGMEKVVCRAVAKVPIVKCWDPVLSLACDINVNNPLALENTRMIRTYVQLDDRVRPLAKIIKYWTKRRLLNDAGKHNSNPPPKYQH
jgi:DNA polymerase sigma